MESCEGLPVSSWVVIQEDINGLMEWHTWERLLTSWSDDDQGWISDLMELIPGTN